MSRGAVPAAAASGAGPENHPSDADPAPAHFTHSCRKATPTMQPQLTNRLFLEALSALVPEEERVLISSVPGDPEEAGAEVWNVKPWRWGDATPPPQRNNYVCVSSFRRGADGWRRRAGEFGRAVAFMVDDVGTKIPSAALSGALPTALIETSPGNAQAWYLLAEPITRYEDFAALTAAFIARWAPEGRDPGMSGPNRVGRLPEGRNGKRKYGGAWACRVLEWRDVRWTREGLLEGLDLRLIPARPRMRPAEGEVSPGERAARAAEFRELEGRLARQGRFLRPAYGRNGRRPLLCPWSAEHTAGATSGTYLTEPGERNRWWGAFVCFHSGTHADACHLRALKRWSEEAEDARLEAGLRAANAEGAPC